MKNTITVLLLALVQSTFAGSDSQLPTPPGVWKDFDTDKGDFKEEIVRQETKDGIHYRDSYISA